VGTASQLAIITSNCCYDIALESFAPDELAFHTAHRLFYSFPHRCERPDYRGTPANVKGQCAMPEWRAWRTLDGAR
jgi:hypothetical protein